MITRDSTVPGLTEARKVQSEIKRMGIPDVELFFDPEIRMWAVCQVKTKGSGVILLNAVPQVEKHLMWWIKDNDSKYRVPSQKDVHNVVAVVRRSQQWFKKGGEKLADALDKQDEDKRIKKEENLRERLEPHLPALKKAIREELG